MKPIYLYHLIQNGRVRYVGITTDISNRKRKHKNNKPPHEFKIIDTFTDKEEAGIAEQYHIAGHNTFKKGWNKSIGGETLLSGKNHPSYIDGRSFDKKAYMREYWQREEVKEWDKKRNQKPERKEWDRKRNQKPERKAQLKAYDKKRRQTPERKAYMKSYRARKKHPIFDLFSGTFI